jgi:hypothetical protein
MECPDFAAEGPHRGAEGDERAEEARYAAETLVNSNVVRLTTGSLQVTVIQAGEDGTEVRVRVEQGPTTSPPRLQFLAGADVVAEVAGQPDEEGWVIDISSGQVREALSRGGTSIGLKPGGPVR